MDGRNSYPEKLISLDFFPVGALLLPLLLAGSACRYGLFLPVSFYAATRQGEPPGFMVDASPALRSIPGEGGPRPGLERHTPFPPANERKYEYDQKGDGGWRREKY